MNESDFMYLFSILQTMQRDLCGRYEFFTVELSHYDGMLTSYVSACKPGGCGASWYFTTATSIKDNIRELDSLRYHFGEGKKYRANPLRNKKSANFALT